jgi:hypothetical protein
MVVGSAQCGGQPTARTCWKLAMKLINSRTLEIKELLEYSILLWNTSLLWNQIRDSWSMEIRPIFEEFHHSHSLNIQGFRFVMA